MRFDNLGCAQWRRWFMNDLKVRYSRKNGELLANQRTETPDLGILDAKFILLNEAVSAENRCLPL